eukprot:m.58680 g.58680  ORF g.58680 m.58680 type:complete len:57 (+) comp34822_c0_seq5:276-446(+)
MNFFICQFSADDLTSFLNLSSLVLSPTDARFFNLLARLDVVSLGFFDRTRRQSPIT